MLFNLEKSWVELTGRDNHRLRVVINLPDVYRRVVRFDSAIATASDESDRENASRHVVSIVYTAYAFHNLPSFCLLVFSFTATRNKKIKLINLGKIASFY